MTPPTAAAVRRRRPLPEVRRGDKAIDIERLRRGKGRDEETCADRHDECDSPGVQVSRSAENAL